MKIKLTILLSIIAFQLRSQEVSIIPQPVSMEVLSGSFTITPNTTIDYSGKELSKSVNFLNDYLQNFYGFKLSRSKNPKQSNVIILSNLKKGRGNVGAYKLKVARNKVMLAGDNEEGVFYGVQSLLQLLPQARSTSLSIQQVTIVDSPRFAYRGLMLDAGRHFFSVEFIKKFIDFIALHKMNVFHWHLTEDQGWRIEIKKYPLLTQVGSCRNETMLGHSPGKGREGTYDGKKYCGYYTKEQIKEVVKYATERYVTVIPEIEMPGHATAALTSYPFLGCTKGPYEVVKRWGVADEVYCAGNDSTYTFIQNVLDEVLTLFPSKYIHIGGDECPKDRWKKCPVCQARIKANGLKDEDSLQSYFVHRIEKYLNSKGRNIIGWDEILEGGLAPNATVMSWRGEKGGIEAAKEKHGVIMSPADYMYFDHAQKKNEDSLTWGSYLPIETLYNYDPVPKELEADQQKYILGAQANVWTEYMNNEKKVEYMVFPRLSALSEVLWSQKENKGFEHFQQRLQIQKKRYDLWKVNYAK